MDPGGQKELRKVLQKRWADCVWEGGQLWMDESISSKGNIVGGNARQEGSRCVPRTARILRNGFICILCDD